MSSLGPSNPAVSPEPCHAAHISKCRVTARERESIIERVKLPSPRHVVREDQDIRGNCSGSIDANSPVEEQRCRLIRHWPSTAARIPVNPSRVGLFVVCAIVGHRSTRPRAAQY